ncbi:uncharacterized protein PHALS_03454 [Plasmopara halstedii]|uniref:Uncharacterized protein n=1 Tax=Plasmopara halstedii TaxID=4781 RepID=A0A0P1B003_PLAHL|nr:uncharacterized protein PHALS_03454 [Plasmopara halstedii]CEG46773.1 hypothetical protein PHALS_03454 [Plasmopara halstedii]|eukprot:XP_024583142.1 hypothetical protein PHALS_03454 [Plasmopara halstedii]
MTRVSLNAQLCEALNTTSICHVPNLEQGRTTINSEMCITLLVTVSALRGGKTECATNVRGNDTCQTGL